MLESFRNELISNDILSDIFVYIENQIKGTNCGHAQIFMCINGISIYSFGLIGRAIR